MVKVLTSKLVNSTGKAIQLMLVFHTDLVEVNTEQNHVREETRMKNQEAEEYFRTLKYTMLLLC